MVSPNASSLPGLVYLDLSENELERFKFFFNPGENGVLKVANGKNSMTLWSWQMLRVTRAVVSRELCIVKILLRSRLSRHLRLLRWQAFRSVCQWKWNRQEIISIIGAFLRLSKMNLQASRVIPSNRFRMTTMALII